MRQRQKNIGPFVLLEIKVHKYFNRSSATDQIKMTVTPAMPKIVRQMKVGKPTSLHKIENMLAHLARSSLQLNDFGQRFALYTDQKGGRT